MMSHTPGPWRVSKCRLGNKLLIEHGDADTMSPIIGSVYLDEGRLPQTANASLIAAAPELLTELKMLHRAYCFAVGFEGRQHQVAVDALAAITRAEGRES